MSQTEPFVMVPVSVLDAGLTPQAFMTYAAIRRHADNDTLETYVGRERLAGYLGLKKVASVDRYTRELVDAGLIEVSDRWCSKLDRRDWVATKDAAHTIQGSNLYTITAGQTGSLLGDSGGPVEGTQGVPQKGHELDPSTYTHTTTKDETLRSAEPTAQVLPIEWKPNKWHRAEAKTLGMNVEAVSEKFRAGMTASGERRTNWGSAFMAYLRAEANGRAEVTFTAVDADAAEAANDAIVDAEFLALQAAAARVVPAAVVEVEAVVEAVNVPVPAVVEVSEYREVEAAFVARPWMRGNAELVALAESLAVEGSGRYPIMRALDAAEAAARRSGRVA